MSLIFAIAILVAGFIAGFISAVSGGGGLVSISLLLAFGISPQTTLATSKFGGLGTSIGGLYKYIKHKKIIWKYVLGLSAAGILGSLIGSRILIDSSQSFLKTFTVVMLLLLVPTIFIRKSFGVEWVKKSRAENLLGYAIYFLLTIIASFFGGLGMILITVVIFFFGLPFLEASATEFFSFTVFSIVSTVIFVMNGLVDYGIGILLFLGMLVGGYIGAHTAIKKGSNWVKVFFAFMVIASVIKVLLT